MAKGYWVSCYRSVIEARDLNEAIQLAARIPPAEIGSIEVRPVRTLKVS